MWDPSQGLEYDETVQTGLSPDLEQVVHASFEPVAHAVLHDLPVYIYGPAGSGKNVLVEQVALALDLDFHFMGCVTDEFKLSGFVDARGVYHETEFYRAFKDGGIFFLDEFDASDPAVAIALNGAIANRYFSFPTETLRAHPDFRVVAAGNTLGTGRDDVYTGRMQLDAASLNRFVTIPVDYDPMIDSFCAKGDGDLLAFIHAYRSACSQMGIPSVASYRNIKMIKAFEDVMIREQVLELALVKDLGPDDVNALLGTGLFDMDNHWSRALRDLAGAEG
ncbi:MAG: AAA family ATPase [Coriobacteriales bacterium]|jgi:cobaltochelatase CobS